MRLPAPIPDAKELPIEARDVMKDRSDRSVGSALSRICKAPNPRFERLAEKAENETVEVASKATSVGTTDEKCILSENVEGAPSKET